MVSNHYLNLILIVLVIFPAFQAHKVFKLHTQFFFDPVSNNACDETNYWTPFDQSTTCYRFVSIVHNDKEENAKIKLMLDHNIAVGTHTNYAAILKEKTSSWKRYTGEIDIIDEATIYKLMKYKEKPTIKKSVSPPIKLGQFCSNSRYIVNGKQTNEKGYWTKTTYNINLAYAIDSNGDMKIISNEETYGIRPVIHIEKSKLKEESGVVKITSILKNAKTIKYNHEDKKYEGHIYKQLQGFTVTKEKLVFMASNNSNKAKSIMYSYKLSDLKKLYRKEYGKTGHGNAMTYNSKANQVLVVGPDEYKKIFVYNEKDLKKKKEITSHHHCSSIGYDASNDLYVQHAGKRIFMTDTSDDLKKLHDFDIHPFETTQDLEYHNGYTFFCTTDAGAKSTYQNYAFFSEGDNIIYVYNTQLDKEKKPNKNFGRLVARLHITGLGELESVSFHDGNMYFGFAPHSHDSHSYVFYKVNYKEFAKEVKKIK